MLTAPSSCVDHASHGHAKFPGNYTDVRTMLFVTIYVASELI